MDFQSILFYVFIFISLVNVLHLGLYLVGADLYDMWQMFRKKTLHTKKPRGRQPLVSVIVPAHNEELTIRRTLESISQSTYPHYEIIVVDDGSKDNTSHEVRKFIRRQSYRQSPTYMARGVRGRGMIRRLLPQVSQPIAKTTLVRQANGGKASAMNNAIQNVARGSLIMCLDADSILHKDAIKNAVSYFRDKSVAAVAANVRVMDESSVIGLLQKFEHMIGYRSKKFYTMFNAEFIVGGVASTYRKSILKQVKFYDTDTMTEDIGLSMKVAAMGNKKHRIVYAVDVVAMTEGVQTMKALLKQRYRWKMGSMQNLLKHKNMFGNVNRKYSKMLTMYRIPMAYLSEIFLILQPVILGYIVYLSLRFDTALLFTGAYMTITAYVLWNIWPDEHFTLARKLKMSLYAPAVYFMFYLMDMVQIVSIIRCLINPKQMLRKAGDEGKWVSPERAGGIQPVAFS